MFKPGRDVGSKHGRMGGGLRGFLFTTLDRSDLVVIYYPVASSGLPYHVRCWANVMCNAPEYLNSSMNLKVERREPVNVRVYALIVSIGETWLL